MGRRFSIIIHWDRAPPAGSGLLQIRQLGFIGGTQGSNVLLQLCLGFLLGIVLCLQLGQPLFVVLWREQNADP